MQRGILALVVDDSEINLIVAQEVLRAISVEAELAGSGAKAVEMCKLRRYDIVLMDHLMPEMDGIEAAKLIRAVTDAPVVALTANEDPDAQALFLENGFAGMLQKPIDVAQLSDMLARLLPKKKPRTDPIPNARTGEGLYEEDDGQPEDRPAGTLPVIAAEVGLDVQNSLAKLGGNEAAYVSILKLFAQSGPEKLRTLEDMLASWNWKDFLIAIHGQKSALANVGATALSEEARALEKAVRDGKHELVEAVFSGFHSRYLALCEKLNVLWPEEPVALRDATEQDSVRLTEILREIVGFLDNLEQEEALEALAPVIGIRYGEPLTSSLAALHSAIGSYAYDEAAAIIKRLSKGVSE
ncbi:MAG: response regulator [Oscillospiraceae bacterium]|jgi:CheY-like chemotaxis protein|nr:response regulator [Oscillospiraceae bacterium]